MYAAANNSDQMLQYPPRPLVMERRSNKSSAAEVAPNCPRCASPNTKFCYYNNYSFSQPRYFCKGCRRYWTRGGSLRDVPVGGGCRKTRRAKAVRSSQNQRPSTITSDPPPVAPPSRSGGSDIDLAEVFAKFLNQNQNSSVGNTDQLVGSESPNESNSNPLLLTQETGDQNQQEEEQLVQEFVDRDLDSLGLQTMVSDHVLDQDLLWCDDATALPGFSWQPMVELREFGSFSSDDDQPEISANVISDNWNLFDLSAYI